MQTRKKLNSDTEALVAKLREKNDEDISLLCDAVENAIPALDHLQKRLERQAYIAKQDGLWHLFAKSGDSITSGRTIREMLINLIFVDC